MDRISINTLFKRNIGIIHLAPLSGLFVDNVDNYSSVEKVARS